METPSFSELFDASPNCYMVLDRDLRFVAANRAYLEATGSTLDQLLGHGLFDRFPNDPGDPANEPRRLLEASLRKVLRTRERDVLAYIPYRVAQERGGEPALRIWSATHVPLLDRDGEVRWILQHTEDITRMDRESSSAATVLSRAEVVQRDYAALGDRWRNLVSTLAQAPGFVAMLQGPHHVFEFANHAYERLVGGREVTGRTVREALPEVADQGFLALLDQVYQDKEPFVGRGMRVELAQADGGRQEVFVDFVYQPIFGPDGEVFGVLVQGYEITELVHAGRRDRFRALASENLATAHDDLDEALVRIAWSAVDTIADWTFVDRFEEETSCRLVAAHAAPEEAETAAALMRYATPLRPPAGHPHAELALTPLLTPRVTGEMLDVMAYDDEHRAWLERLEIESMLAVPLHHRGRPYGVLSLVTCRPRRRFDAADVAPMGELGGLIATAFDNARLAREREQALRSAEEARLRAEASSRAKDDFMAVLGHELRNPLAPILSAVDIMRLGRDPERPLAIIERQAQHLVRLVDDMLDVSRIVHGKLELRSSVVRVGDIVRQALEAAGEALEAKGHQVHVCDLPHTATVHGDEARLVQVVTNLLTNAARYTPPGGHVWIEVSAADDQAVIVVRDDGVGVAPDLLPRVFDMFVQAPQTNDRTTGGLGLGLTLVKRLVELHDGSITVASAGIDQGSEWTVRLPLRAPEESAELASPPLEGERRPARRVELVDDNVDAVELLGTILEGRGHVVGLSYDGPSALARLSDDPPEVAIIDIGLPGMDGCEVATRLRAALKERTPKLIALTGYGDARDRERTRAAGFDQHLLKPVDIAEVIALVEDG